MKKQTCYIGGFAATNSGIIQNSYSIVQVENKGHTAGGFVGNNEGRTDFCFCDTKIKYLTGGFAGKGKELSDNCYFFHSEEYHSSKLEKLQDSACGKNRDDVASREQAEKLKYDFTNIWEYNKDAPIFRFQSNQWMYDTADIFEEPEQDEIINIDSASQLFDFANRVNSGNLIYREAHARLTKDIDLGGKEWIPIGENLRRSFQGVFDGCGHTVSNFKITDEQLENKGFFGFSSGNIFNLTVDCIIQGNGCIGGLAAQNTNGIIGCCAAVVIIRQKKNKEEQGNENLAIGGLVGHNSGTVFESYAAGHISFSAVFIFWPFIGLGAGIAALGTTLVLINVSSGLPDTSPVFNKIPEEIKQTVIEEDSNEPRTDSNFVSFQFNKEIQIDLDVGTCTLDYKNPGDSNHNTVVELQITDAVAEEAMNATGRDEILQAEYEARDDYDPEAFRVTIAQSESISPGYQVTALSLSDFAKQNMAPGTYEAVIMIYPYDTETNNKAMLESQLPVTIVVQ